MTGDGITSVIAPVGDPRSTAGTSDRDWALSSPKKNSTPKKKKEYTFNKLVNRNADDVTANKGFIDMHRLVERGKKIRESYTCRQLWTDEWTREQNN